ncbi:Pre-mRNA-splicing factor [Penicillium chrysogenum]|uniref:Splicing factor YJU2 n=1 Tax=Penicillium chrysogenum TaxID=5076 RepID=A0A167UCS2_PENCH|nr:Pre-mRNA-splicing factor [Penicillium chrysogenum]
MAERKVLSKYYPPDFDPSAIASSSKRSRKDGKAESKLSASRLMTPFSMKCTHCGEFIPKGRKFNARKQILDERYLSIPIYRFHIRCTRCSGEITFRTDPKNNDYQCESGAKRNFEVWRDETDEKYNNETEEQTLDRLEREHGAKEEQLERDKMAELEDKMLDSKREMQIADALDEIRTRNARIERNEARAGDAAIATVQEKIDEDALRLEREAAEDAEALRQFRAKQHAAKQAKLDEEIAEFERQRNAPCDTSSWRKELMERRAELRARRLERKQRLGQQKK